jgi:nitrate/TMAO reductase-like tetraheme cytochrome c subunit
MHRHAHPRPHWEQWAVEHRELRESGTRQARRTVDSRACAMNPAMEIVNLANSTQISRRGSRIQDKDTIHAKNRTWVKTICSDCHVPHEFIDAWVRKLKASSDVVHHVLGTIDTKEEFEAHRLEMATRMWRTMKTSHSRECRNCHDVSAMDPDRQGKTAQKQHFKLANGERTCIDCHFGISHREPDGGVEPRDLVTD